MEGKETAEGKDIPLFYMPPMASFTGKGVTDRKQAAESDPVCQLSQGAEHFPAACWLLFHSTGKLSLSSRTPKIKCSSHQTVQVNTKGSRRVRPYHKVGKGKLWLITGKEGGSVQPLHSTLCYSLVWKEEDCSTQGLTTSNAGTPEEATWHRRWKGGMGGVSPAQLLINADFCEQDVLVQKRRQKKEIRIESQPCGKEEKTAQGNEHQ